jgi:DNA-binding transcriptional ArsR family regulator
MNELPKHDAAAGGDPLQPDECAKKLKALAAPQRLKILRFLRDGPHNVGEIAVMLGVDPVDASHHLTVLKVAGLIRGDKRGRFVDYSLVPGVLETEEAKAHLNLGCCTLTARFEDQEQQQQQEQQRRAEE